MFPVGKAVVPAVARRVDAGARRGVVPNANPSVTTSTHAVLNAKGRNVTFLANSSSVVATSGEKAIAAYALINGFVRQRAHRSVVWH